MNLRFWAETFSDNFYPRILYKFSSAYLCNR
jgi:hypothetical protein